MIRPLSPPQAIRIFAGLALRRFRRGAQLWLTLGILGVPVIAAAAALSTDNAGYPFFKQMLELYLRFLVPFVMALYASTTVAEEVQAKTITYPFSRPVPRWTLPVGKYLGAIVINGVIISLSLALVFVLSLAAEGSLLEALPQLGQGLLALLLAVALFGAVATAFGTVITGYPFVATGVFFLVVEVGFAAVPGWLKITAMTVHLRTIAGVYQPKTLMFLSDPNLSVGIALSVVLTMTLLWLAVAAVWISRAEYKITS